MSKPYVLIVDDEARNQRILTETLDGMMPFKTASTGEEALRVAETEAPDLVLLDIMMPGIDGYEVCRRLKGDPRFALTKIILVSGKAMIEERLKGYECGADDYLAKPFVPEELLAKVKVFTKLTSIERQLTDLNNSLDNKVQERTGQLMAAEAKLANAAKMSALGEMAGGIAHEINTPLSTITLVAAQIFEVVQETPVDTRVIQGMAESIQKTVERIGLIIRGLRTFSRDGSQDKLENASVQNILNTTLSLCTERLKHEGVTLKVDAVAADLTLSCRQVQISQVLLNLISNACDAVQRLPEKWIQISAAKKATGVEISVIDSGSGIPQDVQDKVFQPFFTTKEIGKGTGLGLSISKGIIESHGGQLKIDRHCPHTRFVLFFPDAAASEQAS